MLYNPVKPLYGMIIVGREVLKACDDFFFLCAFYYEPLERRFFEFTHSHSIHLFCQVSSFWYHAQSPVVTRRTRKDCKTHWWRKTKKWSQKKKYKTKNVHKFCIIPRYLTKAPVSTCCTWLIPLHCPPPQPWNITLPLCSSHSQPSQTS